MLTRCFFCLSRRFLTLKDTLRDWHLRVPGARYRIFPVSSLGLQSCQPTGDYFLYLRVVPVPHRRFINSGVVSLFDAGGYQACVFSCFPVRVFFSLVLRWALSFAWPFLSTRSRLLLLLCVSSYFLANASFYCLRLRCSTRIHEFLNRLRLRSQRHSSLELCTHPDCMQETVVFPGSSNKRAAE